MKKAELARPSGLTDEEIEKIQRKLALITPLNKKICNEWSFNRNARVHLASFSDDSLKYAESFTARSIIGEERFAEFCRNAKAHSVNTNRPYDRAFHVHLLKIFNIDPKQPCVRHNKITLSKQDILELQQRRRVVQKRS